MKTKNLELICFGFLLLGACRLGPEYAQPIVFDNEVLTATMALQTPAVPALPFQPKDLNEPDLNNLIQMALENAPDIKTAKAHVEAARNIRLSTIAGLFPAVDGEATYSYQKLGKNAEQPNLTDVYKKGLNISWEIDLFGRQQNEIAAASAQEQQMRFALENINVLLVSEVSLAYINLRTSQQLLEQTKENLKIQKALTKLTREKYRSGLADAIAVNQAEYQLATTKANIPKLESDIEQYQNTLAILVGQPAGSLHQTLKNKTPNLITKKFNYPLDKLYAIPVEVLRLRPDVQGMEASLKQQNAEVGLATSNLFPTVSLSAFFGFESAHAHNLFERKSYTHAYQATISTALFHFGELWHQLKAQKATMQALTAQYEKTLLTATKEVRDLLVGLNKMDERHQSLLLAWQKMDKAAQLARDKYKSGLIDYSQVLDSEERRINAQSAVTSSNSLLYQNIVNFYKAVGGQFAFDQLKEKTSK